MSEESCGFIDGCDKHSPCAVGRGRAYTASPLTLFRLASDGNLNKEVSTVIVGGFDN